MGPFCGWAPQGQLGAPSPPFTGQLGSKMTEQRFLWSVMPCLMAWPTVAMTTSHAASVQVALLGLLYFVDRAWAQRGLLPRWYMTLRLPLTVLAAGGLGLTALSDLAA